MEFLQGESLTALLKKGLQFGRVVDTAWQLASALGAAHKRGIVHRDVKPDNVFVVPDPATPTGDRVKVLDFGIAKLTSEDNVSMKTRTGTVMGTPVYMSPEQCRGSGEIDHRSDIYAMGCIMYEMACGQPPFVRNGFGELITAHIIEEPDMVSAINPSVPAPFEAIVMKTLEKDPAARHQHMSEVETELGAINPEALMNVTKILAVGRAGIHGPQQAAPNCSLAPKAGEGVQDHQPRQRRRVRDGVRPAAAAEQQEEDRHRRAGRGRHRRRRPRGRWQERSARACCCGRARARPREAGRVGRRRREDRRDVDAFGGVGRARRGRRSLAARRTTRRFWGERDDARRAARGLGPADRHSAARGRQVRRDAGGGRPVAAAPVQAAAPKPGRTASRRAASRKAARPGATKARVGRSGRLLVEAP
jgi:hypothetical protein